MTSVPEKRRILLNHLGLSNRPVWRQVVGDKTLPELHTLWGVPSSDDVNGGSNELLLL